MAAGFLSVELMVGVQGTGQAKWLFWIYMSTLWASMGIYAEAILAHVPCHPATCDVILCVRISFVHGGMIYLCCLALWLS